MNISKACVQTLALSALPGFGLKKFHMLHQYFGSIGRLFSAVEAQGALALDKLNLSAPLRSEIVALIEGFSVTGGLSDGIACWLEHQTNRVICLDDADYPDILLQVYCPPPLLYLRGNWQALSLPALAIVGTRRPTSLGRRNAYDIARHLASGGLSVVSGLALGIDACAHRGALDGGGITCAVLATGLDSIYPKKHQALAEQISGSGVLVSEMPLGTPPVPGNFPRRNRLISGLALGVLVAEADLRSGSLITADYAVEQNREVFAIPGSIHSPVSRGCHQLIKQGAKLVETIDDIVQELGLKVSEVTEVHDEASGNPELSAGAQRLLANMDHNINDFDALVCASGCSPASVNLLLVELELSGIITSVPGGYQRVNTVKSRL